MENLPTAAKMSRIRRENDKTTRRTRNPAFKAIAALPARIAELDAKHNAPLKAPETSGTPPHRHRRTRSPTIRITARNLAGAATASATCWPSSPTAPSMRRGLPHARDCPGTGGVRTRLAVWPGAGWHRRRTPRALGEWQVGGDDDRAARAEAADPAGQQLGGGLGKGQAALDRLRDQAPSSTRSRRVT